MGLAWDVSACDDHKALWVKTGEQDDEGKDLYSLNAWTDRLIWLTMACYCDLKGKNFKEFLVRIKFLELMHPNTDYYKVPHDILLRNEGLWTNASSMSRAKWLKSQSLQATDRIEAALKNKEEGLVEVPKTLS
jgi:hypothetical protein